MPAETAPSRWSQQRKDQEMGKEGGDRFAQDQTPMRTGGRE